MRCEKKNTVGQTTDDMAHAHYTYTKTTNTHSEYAIGVSLALQQQSHEGASMLR
jgi:hypothetical protein